jgi:hypothetical protein
MFLHVVEFVLAVMFAYWLVTGIVALIAFSIFLFVLYKLFD